MENNNPPPIPPSNEDDLNKEFNQQFGNQNRNTPLPDENQNKINQQVNPYEQFNNPQNVNPAGGNNNQGPFNQNNPNQFNQSNQNNGNFNQNPYNQGGGNYNQNIPPNQFGNPYMQRGLPVPNATAVLVLGIISLVTWICYGIVGLILAIIALVISKKGMEAYNQNPGLYDPGSYNNLKAGRICAIIGLVLGILFVFIFAVAIIAEISRASNHYRF